MDLSSLLQVYLYIIMPRTLIFYWASVLYLHTITLRTMPVSLEG